MKQLAITALLSLLIVGCASTGKQSSYTPQEYFAEDNKTGKSSEQIKKELWRQGTNSMIGDAVTVEEPKNGGENGTQTRGLPRDRRTL